MPPDNLIALQESIHHRSRFQSTTGSATAEILRLVTNLGVRSASWFSGVVSGCSVDDMEDRSELRSRALARNKRDLTAVTEIPAASATSLLDL